jgi:CelD/BcsL family acetyltransferase involved in cellulose biosynthesis
MMIRIYEQADQLDARAWESIQSDADVALSHAGIRLAERTAGVEMRYIVATAEDGTWVGGLPVALATATARWVLGRPDALLERALHSGEPGADEALELAGGSAASVLPSLLLGGRHMGNSTMLVAQDAPAGTAELLLRTADDLAERLEARSTSAVFVADSDEPFIALLRKSGYVPFGVNRYSSLQLAEGGFEAWIASFAKKKRWKIRDERRRITEAGFRSRVLRLSDVDLTRLGLLETELLQKYGHVWKPEFSVETFERIVSVFGDDAMVSVVERDSEIAGFVILLRRAGRWSARQVGFDYEMQGHLPLYFETLFYGPIEAAPSLGIQRIDFGLGSEEAKVSRGCFAETQRTWVKADRP